MNPRVAAGDWLEHMDRPGQTVTLAELCRVIRDPRAPVEALLRAAHAGGLDEQWAGKLGQRAEWLSNNRRGGAA